MTNLQTFQRTKPNFLGTLVLTFSKLVFYLNAESVVKLTECIDHISKINESDKVDILAIKEEFAKITQLLVNEIVPKKVQETCYVELFNKFNININDLQSNTENDTEETSKTPTELSSISPKFQLGNSLWSHQFWHFCALDMSKQIEHRNVLAVIEYGEMWRTKNIQKVKEGDLIFLFARGGGGYCGVYRAKNAEGTDSPALIFQVDDKRKQEDPEYAAEINEKYERYGKSFDIYNAYSYGATSIAAINVEEIYFNKEGIGNPIAVRRATIIPFLITSDREKLIFAFDKAMNEQQ